MKIIALFAVAAVAVVGVAASASVRDRPQAGHPWRGRATPGRAGASQGQVRTDLAAAVALAPPSSRIAAEVAAGRRATAKYQTDLALAQAHGYRILTRMIPDMGYHFIDPSVKRFDVRRPPILVYEHRGRSWQLGAFEWVFTSKPAKPPIPGAQYGVFGAACHYVDGTFVFADAQDKCAAKSPETGAAFNFWHPRLITLHLWLWYPNPSGLFMGTNPLVAPFNHG